MIAPVTLSVSATWLSRDAETTMVLPDGPSAGQPPGAPLSETRGAQLFKLKSVSTWNDRRVSTQTMAQLGQSVTTVMQMQRARPHDTTDANMDDMLTQKSV